MCKWGDTIAVWVLIPADLSWTGKRRWKHVGIDRCIAPIISALAMGGMETRASCCGHGNADGSIILADGRELVIPRAVASLNASEAVPKHGAHGRHTKPDLPSVSALELAVDPSWSTPKEVAPAVIASSPTEGER